MRIIHRSRYTTVILPKHCPSEISLEQHAEIAKLLNISNNLLVNAIETAEMDGLWFEVLLLLKSKLSSIRKKLHLVNLTAALEEKLIQYTPQHKDLTSPGIGEALAEFKSDSIHDTTYNFIKAFVQTTPLVLYLQFRTLSTQKKIALKKGDVTLLPGNISGVIKVSSPELYYAVFLSFPSDTFLKIMSNLLGETFTEINQGIQDGAAELLSIIYRQARALMQTDNSKVIASIPEVFVGNKIKSLDFDDQGSIPVEEGKMVTITFETHFGDFYIEAWLPTALATSILA